MPLIKARTRGKQLVRHITRFDRETNETLYAYAHFLGEPTEYVAESARRHDARQGQGVHGVASRASGVVRRAASAAPASVRAAHFRQQNCTGVSACSGWRGRR